MYMYGCNGVCVEIRVQLMGVSSLSIMLVPGNELRSSDLGASILAAEPPTSHKCIILNDNTDVNVSQRNKSF